MQLDRLFSVWGAVLCACILFAAQTAHAQAKSAALRITVYESPT